MQFYILSLSTKSFGVTISMKPLQQYFCLVLLGVQALRTQGEKVRLRGLFKLLESSKDLACSFFAVAKFS